MAQAYDHYFKSGHYSVRYPRHNFNTLSRVQRVARPGCTVLDIGAGNGRYAVPLARRGCDVVAVERSRQARIQLARYARELRVDDRIEIRSDLTELHGGLPDCRVALLLFGVLGHMTFDQRRETLDWVRACLAPDARVIGSVPNRARRFRREQRLSRIPDGGLAPRFAYERTIDGVTDVFEYTAFSPRDLAEELREHSWTCLSLTPESVMTERIATRWDAAGRIDSVLTHLLPPGLGYCIAFEAVADRSRVSTVHPMCDARRLRAS